MLCSLWRFDWRPCFLGWDLLSQGCIQCVSIFCEPSVHRGLLKTLLYNYSHMHSSGIVDVVLREFMTIG